MTQSIPQIPTANPHIYHAALEAVVRVDDSSSGRVRLAGLDRAALLQRLTTNDVVRLKPGEGTRTVLVNHHARILDVLTVYALPEHLLVVTQPGSSGQLGRFLQGKIFFNDKVTVEDVSSGTLQLQLYGKEVPALINELTSLDVQSWPVHHIQAATIGNAQVWIARTLPLGGSGFVVFAQNEARESVEGAFATVPLLDPPTFEVLRIEHGYGAPRREHSTEYIPLETGLADAVSFTKGCYVGQEIIARMESRNRLAKRLIGLRLERAVEPGGKLMHENKAVGDLTSTAISPRFGPIGLGYVRTAMAVPGTAVEAGAGVTAQVVELPFTY